MLLRVARAHMHTVLPHLLALSHADRFAPGEGIPTVDRGRLEAAQQLLRQLRADEEKAAAAATPPLSSKPTAPAPADRGSIVDGTQLLFDFYLQVRLVACACTWHVHVQVACHCR